MKNTLKALALVLSAILLLTTVTAFAEEEYEICMVNCALNIEFCNIEGKGAE